MAYAFCGQNYSLIACTGRPFLYIVQPIAFLKPQVKAYALKKPFPVLRYKTAGKQGCLDRNLCLFWLAILSHSKALELLGWVETRGFENASVSHSKPF